MNAYPNFNPPCLDKDASIRERPNPKAQTNAYPAQPSFLPPRCRHAIETHSSVLVESALSPAKYAIFQVAGTSLLQLCSSTRSPNSYMTSAKIGAFGGIIVTIFYLMLVLTRNIPVPEDDDDKAGAHDAKEHRRSLYILLHETLYSALASAIGSMAYSRSGAYHVDIFIQTFTGSVGPVVFLLALGVLVGATWCVMRAYKKAMDWYAGY
ncbi:hypothetical protein D9611_001995 [Ephemerocybe angulata]|uniref:Uncharacterized protein n=1 Tax=Ephemerocybe angulata TaxID=980116 RepID=A0A8H5CH59_9AGAR|nr:hypothetical protein D9611_001995 [Tulosesus angulatus]